MTRSTKPKMALLATTVACLLASLPAMSRAEQRPDPVAFIAGQVAFAEFCESAFPNMHDLPGRLWRGIEADCSAHGPAGAPPAMCIDMRARFESSPKFVEALETARTTVRRMPGEKVSVECKSLSTDLK